MENNIACFIGHRNTQETEELKDRLYKIIEELITEKAVSTFLFGSKSRFNDLCLEVVSQIKDKYPHVKRIYVRAEFPIISDEYKAYLLKNYEDTYYPENLIGAGKAVYVERNIEMINRSLFCIVYYDESNTPTARKSGTKIALDYAIKCKKKTFILNQFQLYSFRYGII